MRKKEAYLAGVAVATILMIIVAVVAYACYTMPVLQYESVNGSHKVLVYELPDGKINVSDLLVVLVAQVTLCMIAMVLGYAFIEED